MDSLIALIIGLAIGIGFYYYDLKKGAKGYRNWYNLTHKDKMEPGKDMGFVFNQPFSKRLVPAIALALLVCLVLYITGNLNVIMIIIYGAVVFAGCMVSFYLSPFIFKSVPAQLEKISRVIERVDEIEEGMRGEKENENENENENGNESEDRRVESGDPALEASGDEKNENGNENENEDTKPRGDDDSDDDWRKGVKDFLDK